MKAVHDIRWYDRYTEEHPIPPVKIQCSQSSHIVSGGRGGPATSGPVGMEHGLARLIDSLVHVRAEVIALGLW